MSNFEKPTMELEKPAEMHLTRMTKAIIQQKVHDSEDSGGARHDYLASQANWAARLLLELAKQGKEGEEISFDQLKPAVLNSCMALAFVNAHKGGLAVSLASGYGFVIKKISQDTYGNSSWGQPLFFTVSQAGIGLTAGYQKTQSVIAVLAAGSMDVFKTGTNSLGTDLGLFSTDGALMGMSGGAALGGSQHMGMSVSNEKSAFCYSKVDGMYLEISLHGSHVVPDKEVNETLYGEGYDADAVLESNTGPYLHDMMPLYKTINHLGKLAMQGA